MIYHKKGHGLNMPLGGYLVSAAISTFDIWDLSFKDSPDVDDSEALTTPFLRGAKRGITKAFKFVSIQFHVICVVHEYNLSRSVCRSFPSSADMISWYGCLFYCPGQCLQVDLRTAVNPAQHWALWHTWFQFRWLWPATVHKDYLCFIYPSSDFPCDCKGAKFR